MHIVFANRYFAPDASATSQIVSDLARYLAAQGHRVEVLTSRQLYDDPRAKLRHRQSVDGVLVRRIWTSRFGRQRLLGRGLDYLSFYLSFFCHSLALLRRDSVLVCCTDPPLLSIPAHLACRLRRAQLVNWLQDIYPEVAVGLGMISERSPSTLALKWLRNNSLRRARQNVALGDVMAEKVHDCGVDRTQIRVIHNWSVAATVPGEPGEQPLPLRRAWGVADQFVVGYSGNLGRAHEIDTVLQAAQILQPIAGICFLFVGAGVYTKQLRDRARALQLQNIHFQPYQPLDQLHHSLAAADVHLVILRPELEGYIVPSKFYGAAASGRPLIFIGAAQGEVARILQREEAGLTVATGDGKALASAVLSLRDDRDLRDQFGANARRLSQNIYNRAQSLAQWTALFS